MAKDYYKILGVDSKSSKDDIKKAFRKIAHLHHPDKGGGNADKFKEASEAYSVLSDDQKRSQYDQFGAAAFGAAGGASGGASGFGGQGFGGFGDFDFSQFSGFGGQGGFSQGGVEFDLGDILGGIFGGGGSRRQRRGAHITVDIEITFKESIFGTERLIAYTKTSNKKKESLTVRIPPGVESGETLRVIGRGEEVEGGRAGDLYVRIHVSPDKILHKEGHNIVTNLTIKLSEALLGGERKVHSVDGDLTVKIPEGISNGEILRVQGKGVPYEGTNNRGDFFIRIAIDMPKKLSKEMRKLVEEMKEKGL